MGHPISAADERNDSDLRQIHPFVETQPNFRTDERNGSVASRADYRRRRGKHSCASNRRSQGENSVHGLSIDEFDTHGIIGIWKAIDSVQPYRS